MAAVQLSVKLRVVGEAAEVFSQLPGLIAAEAIFPESADSRLRSKFVVRVEAASAGRALSSLESDSRVEYAEVVPDYSPQSP